jgi:uncharacterized sulfatase
VQAKNVQSGAGHSFIFLFVRGKRDLLSKSNIVWNRPIIAKVFAIAWSVLPLELSVADPPVTAGKTAPTRRPNVVWIISQDTAKHDLNHFDASGTPTPAIEALAKEGVTFDRAFSCGSVSSVAQTTLVTGCYAPRIGTAYHRAIEPAMVPAGVKLFPTYLRKQGYYTTNQNKQNYNVRKGPKVWDDSSPTAHWSNRVDGSKQSSADAGDPPFFHVQTLNQTREGHLQDRIASDGDGPPNFDANHSKAMLLPPCFPDADVFRKTATHHQACINRMDQQVQAIVDELDQAGELENTFLFYFGDHGGALPRSKGHVFETGLHVPLVVRIPENFQYLVKQPRGSRTDAFVEFVDFAPTVLNLASVAIPKSIDGTAFLGKDASVADIHERDEAFGHVDRVDEKYDLVRSLRMDDWKYIRNFEPHYPAALYNETRYKMQAMQQWRQMYQDDELNEVQAAFFRRRTPEALYYLKSDPYETVNLAGRDQHSEVLLRMRERLMERLVDMNDLGFIPEAWLIDGAMTDPVTFGRRNRDVIRRLIETANLQLLDWNQAKPKIIAAINDQDAMVRIWGLVSASSFASQFVNQSRQGKPTGSASVEIIAEAQRRLVDLEPLVVIRAVELLSILKINAADSIPGQPIPDPRPFLYRSLQRSVSEAEALRVLNTVVFVRDHCFSEMPNDDRWGIDPKQLQLIIPYDANSLIQRRMTYLLDHP